ncbi:hypothetical protein [Mesorhizobium sp. A623]
MSAPHPSNKPSGRYIGRVSPFKVFSPEFPTTDYWSATVIFVDADGLEYRTDYEHPRCPRYPGDWHLDNSVRSLMSFDINAIAADFNSYMKRTGNRFEQMHPDWWAPGVRDLPPFYANDDDPGDPLAA